MRQRVLAGLAGLTVTGWLSTACTLTPAPVLTVAGSAVGREGDVLRAQLAQFAQLHPDLRVRLRPTPDAADQRHQLYVQWLNGHAQDPDVLQLDVIWTAEFAAAGWIAPAADDPFGADVFPAAITAGRWQQTTYALPWFVDVGMLYRRTDLAPDPPKDLDELFTWARRAVDDRHVPFGLVWQGARYEGLVTVFLEYLGAFGGDIMDADGRVRVDGAPAVAAVRTMRDAIRRGLVPDAALTWQEEQTRFAFQNGQAAFMRNWPYAFPLLEQDGQSRVAGRVAVSAMPSGAGGTATAALGGAMLALNARSDQPDAARRLVTYLLAPAQMRERARVAGQYPPRPSLYASGDLHGMLPVEAAAARAIIERARPRPVTPVYTELSDVLQRALHRALTGQQSPEAALDEAARTMRGVLRRARLGPEAS